MGGVGCFRRLRLLWFRLVVDQDSNGGGFQIVVLAASNAHDARDCSTRTQQEGQRQSDEQNTHDCFSRKMGHASVSASTVTELIGIKIAATRGLIRPDIAKATATKL